MIEVDRLMIDEFGIALIQMMENAGRHLARLAAVCFLKTTNESPKVTILCGSGGNGGGGLVCARRLAAWGVDVQVALSKEAALFSGVPAHQLHILHKMRVPVLSVTELRRKSNAHLIIDTIIGYSLKGPPTGSAAQMIRWANKQPLPILSLDIPSGVEGSTGDVYEPAIRARATMTLALPKKGLFTPSAPKQAGQLYLADIGVPPELYKNAFGFDIGTLFSASEILIISPKSVVPG